MGKAKYYFNDIGFTTKKEITEYIRSIVNKYKNGESLGTHDFNFMLEVLKEHPKADIKIGCGVKDLVINETVNQYYKKTRFFIIIRNDDSQEDFSWVKCLGSNKNLARHNFLIACRNTVVDQIKEYRDMFKIGSMFKIENGEILPGNMVHVDHVSPLFNELVNNFIEKYNINILSCGITNNKMIKLFANRDIEIKFTEYHKKYAVLRLIRSEDNLRRKKEDKNIVIQRV